MPDSRISLSEDLEATNEVVATGLKAFNRTYLGEYSSEPIAIEVRDDEGVIVGGAVGAIQLGWLFIDMIWLPESHRSQGIGSKVLAAIEQEAVQRGADRAILDTMGYQAEGFYARYGYVECGRVANFASGHDRIYMIKTLVK